MINQQLTSDWIPEDYRGSIVYTQEHSYKTFTIMVKVAPDEQSHVITHSHNLPIIEEAEHLQHTDLYHFAATDGTRIQLTLETPAGNTEVWYTVAPDDIVAEKPTIHMDIVRSEDSLPFEYAYAQKNLDEALTYYADQIPDWLNETARDVPDHQRDAFER